MMAVSFFIAHEKGFKFHAKTQTGAYSCNCSSRRAKKDDVMYLNSTMDRFRTVAISRFQF